MEHDSNAENISAHPPAGRSSASAGQSNAALIVVPGFFTNEIRAADRLTDLFSQDPKLGQGLKVLRPAMEPLTRSRLGRVEGSAHSQRLSAFLAKQAALYRDIFLIGVGFGGVLLKQALLSTPSLADKTRLVIFNGTPAGGLHAIPSGLESILAGAVPFLPARYSLADFWRGSSEMEDLTSQWAKWLNKSGVPVIRVLGTRDDISPLDPAQQSVSESIYMTPYSHQELLSKENDPVLHKLLSDSLETPGGRSHPRAAG